MKRELATHQADLPHDYDDAAVGTGCALCGQDRGGPLHTVQTPREQASERNSNTMLRRELGS